MSASVSTRSKTLSDTEESDSIDNPLIEDRWSNNICYRQLVISSCIGAFQLCWHPYLHDLRRLVPFLFLYNMFSLLVAYPMFYLELAMGAVTRKGVLNCWDLAPMARGVGFAMVACSMFSALAASAMGARCLALLVHSFHSFLPWLHCAAAAVPPCAARHRPLPPGSDTPAQSFYFNFVLQLKRDGFNGGLGNVVWELATYYIICWVLIYFIAIKRIYSYSKLVLFKDVLAFFVLLSCGVGASRLQGAGDVFRKCDWSTMFEGFQMWREAIEYSLVQMSVAQGSLAMFGAYCPKQHKLSSTTLLAVAVSKCACVLTALTLAAAASALQRDYDGKAVLPAGSAAAMVLWADYVARIPGSQFWSALVFFTLFILSLSTAALLVQTMMSSFTGRSIRKITWAFLVVTCMLFCLIGVITICTQGGQYILDFLLTWPISRPRVLITAVVPGVVTFVYGQTSFCEDVFFSVGEYPNVFMRICWALSPILLLLALSLRTGLSLGKVLTQLPFGITAVAFASGAVSWSANEALAGWLLVSFTLTPIAVVMAIYLVFKCRVRNIVRNEK